MQSSLSFSIRLQAIKGVTFCRCQVLDSKLLYFLPRHCPGVKPSNLCYPHFTQLPTNLNLLWWETAVNAYTFYLSTVFHMPLRAPQSSSHSSNVFADYKPRGTSLSWDIQPLIGQGLNRVALFSDCLKGSSKFLPFYLHSATACLISLFCSVGDTSSFLVGTFRLQVREALTGCILAVEVTEWLDGCSRHGARQQIPIVSH